jgi:hypothetical protein
VAKKLIRCEVAGDHGLWMLKFGCSLELGGWCLVLQFTNGTAGIAKEPELLNPFRMASCDGH